MPLGRNGIEVGSVVQIHPDAGLNASYCFMIVVGLEGHGVKGWVPGTNNFRTWVPIVRWEHIALVGNCPYNLPPREPRNV
jgi:hypothetical protein